MINNEFTEEVVLTEELTMKRKSKNWKRQSSLVLFLCLHSFLLPYRCVSTLSCRK